MTHYGWIAVAFAVAAVLIYIAGLMCSHLAAFRIATNLRLAMTKHIATLPLGAIEQFGSGKLRRTISLKLPVRRRPTSPTSCRTRLRRWRPSRGSSRCC